MRAADEGTVRLLGSEIQRLGSLREEVDDFLARTVADGETLKVRTKTLGPSYLRDALLATILRLTEKAREENAELRRAVG